MAGRCRIGVLAKNMPLREGTPLGRDVRCVARRVSKNESSSSSLVLAWATTRGQTKTAVSNSQTRGIHRTDEMDERYCLPAAVDWRGLQCSAARWAAVTDFEGIRAWPLPI